MNEERCELSDLLKIHCAHCLDHKDTQEQEAEDDMAMVSSLLRYNKTGEKR